MQSKATTVEAYLNELPADRREAISAIRKVILKNLDSDFEEGMQYGMIGYYVPHRIFPAGYHCDPKQPLTFAALASQKNHMAVYLMCVYGDEAEKKRFTDAWLKTGKKLDMGKSCIRFRKLENVAIDAIGESIKRISAAGYIEYYERSLQARSAGAKSTAKAKPASKKTITKADTPMAGKSAADTKRSSKAVRSSSATKSNAAKKKPKK